MKMPSEIFHALLASIATFGLAGMTSMAIAQPNVFTDAPATLIASKGIQTKIINKLLQQKYVERINVVTIKPKTFDQAFATFNLFPDKKISVSFDDKRVVDGLGEGYPKTLLTGHIVGEQLGDVLVFVRSDGSISGRISSSGHIYSINPVLPSDSIYVITDNDMKDIPNLCGTGSDPATTQSGSLEK